MPYGKVIVRVIRMMLMVTLVYFSKTKTSLHTAEVSCVPGH